MEKYIEWSKDFETNIPEIDEQHKVILGLLNKVFALLITKEDNKKIDKNEIIAIISELKKYTIYHFQTEEKMFEDCNYEEKEQHISEHNYFIKKVDNFLKRNIDNDELIIVEIVEFLKNWLINHILITDRKYINKLG